MKRSTRGLRRGPGIRQSRLAARVGRGRDNSEEATVYMFFGFLTALISSAAGVQIVMAIMKCIHRSQEIRLQTYM